MAVILSPSLSFCELEAHNQQLPRYHRPLNLLQESLPYQNWVTDCINYDVAPFPPTACLSTPGFFQDIGAVAFPGQFILQEITRSPKLNQRARVHSPVKAKPAAPRKRTQRAKRSGNENSSATKPRHASGVQVADIQPTSYLTKVAALTSFDDVLFSPVDPGFDGARVKINDLCSICRKSFESGEESALATHVIEHKEVFQAEFSCDACKTEFSFRSDLRWHRFCAASVSYTGSLGCSQTGARCQSAERGVEGFMNPLKLREWEQAQLQSHRRQVDAIVGKKPRTKRSSSVPPTRKPVEIHYEEAHSQPSENGPSTMQDPTSNDDARRRERPTHVKSEDDTMELDNEHSSCQSVDNCRLTDDAKTTEAHVALDSRVQSIQDRIKILVDRICPSTESPADSQILSSHNSPDSDFSDSRSLSGAGITPVVPLCDEADSGELVKRAKSAPPHGSKNTHGSSSEQSSSSQANDSSIRQCGPNDMRSGLKSRKRTGNDRANEDGDGERDQDEGSNPKRRKLPAGSSVDSEKRFPCICYIGEPERFAKDEMKHKHISNMCRHLKTHSFYACSTCILQFTSDEDLIAHQDCHIKNCRQKGCKRQRSAFELPAAQCDHIMTPEEQWNALFTLKYKRQPPDVFSAAAKADSHDKRTDIQDIGMDSRDIWTAGVNKGDNAVVGGALQAREEKPSELPSEMDSFFNPNRSYMVPNSDEMPFTGEFNIDDFFDIDAADDTDLVAAEITSPPTDFIARVEDLSLAKLVENLQKQVTSLEKKLEGQASNDKTRIFALQTQVAQLEQKIFQSSKREEQLEATLGVVFDAFEATKAPQVQPHRALWNLVMSHAPGAISSVTSRNRETHLAGDHPGLERETTQTLRSFDNSKQGGASMVRTDSAYGSSQ